MRWRGEVTAGVLYDLYDVVFHDDYGVFLVEQDHEGSDEFDPYEESGGEPLYRHLAARPYAKIKTVIDNVYVVDRLDVGKYLRFTHEDGCVITFPDYVEFPVDAEMMFRQCSVGPLIFNADAGFTLNPPRAGYDSSTFYEGATVLIKFVDVDEADMMGPYGDLLTT